MRPQSESVSQKSWSLVRGLALAIIALIALPRQSAAQLPPGFSDSAVINGLQMPTVVQFAADGRVFVAEKSGLIKVFDGLLDPTPAVFADLRTQVHNMWDRGLLGMALDPQFPTRPYIYCPLHEGCRHRWDRAEVGDARPDRRPLPECDDAGLYGQRPAVAPDGGG